MEANLNDLIKSGVNITVSINLQDLRLILNEALAMAKSPSANQELPRFLTPIQLSELLGLKLSTIYQNHHNGMIPGAKKVGGKLLFDTQVILEWIEVKAIPTREEKIKTLSTRRAK